MKYFLELVAHDLMQHIGPDMSRTVVLFPNKRASLFFNDYLLPADGKPMWAPRYMTVNELFLSLANLELADPIEVICRLYRLYREHVNAEESLDFFYGWGERIMADFDDVDKHMVDARALFTNLRDYETIATSEFLNEEQAEQIRRFVQDFSLAQRSEIRERFLKLWNNLYTMYTELRAELEADGLAYEGQLFRFVAEGLAAGTLSLPQGVEHVAIVGFNVINEVERTLFRSLQQAGMARFYWDYDVYYARTNGSCDNEAGVFMQRNLRDFPNALGPEQEVFSNFLKQRAERTIEFVEASTEAIQAQSITSWLDDPAHYDPQHARRTAVVLCNENLLQPVLHAIPSSIHRVNVTKGFPLSHTAAYARCARLCDELTRKADALADKGSQPALAALLAQMQQAIANEAKQVQQQADTERLMRTLNTEAYFATHTTLARFAHLVQTQRLVVHPTTLFKLIKQVLRQTSIPFHGEPAVGLQIMGVLETRCLDFDHVLMLSVGEGFLPRKATDASFIPYLLRVRYGLTTNQHKTAVFAYYFHRLLQRAKHARLVYNSSTEQMNKGEMSRFMKAMLIEGLVPIRHLRLEATPHPAAFRVDQMPKPANLTERFTRISPSAINTYLRCQLAFYYEKVMRLQADPDTSEIIRPNDFGTVFHHAAECFYNELRRDGRPITPQRLLHFLENHGEITLRGYVKRAFSETGIEAVAVTEQAVWEYMRQLVYYEAGKNYEAPAQAFSVLHTELDAQTDITYTLPDGEHTITLRGNIDRLDEAVLPDGTTCWRVLDYKTGGKPDNEKPKDMEHLFTPNEKHPHYALQTFLYALMLGGKTQLPLVPSLFFVHCTMNENYTPYISFEGQPMLHFQQIMPAFKARLQELLSEMFDPSTPFHATGEDLKHCSSCAYASLCGRG